MGLNNSGSESTESLSPITNSKSQSTESLISRVESTSTESLKSEREFQISHSEQPVLQDQTLEDRFRSCMVLCEKSIEQALKSAKISTYAKTCFHPIACQIDDELIRLELWTLDFGTADGSWEEFSALMVKNDAVDRRLRKVFEDMHGGLESIGSEMKLIQSIVQDAARSPQNPNYDWTTRVDKVISRVNENIKTLSLAVRIVISQRNLISLKEAIERGNSPYDGLRLEPDDSADFVHQYDSNVVKTIQNEQDTKPQKGLDKHPQQKSEDDISPIFKQPASLEDNGYAITQPMPVISAFEPLPLSQSFSQPPSTRADDKTTTLRELSPRIQSVPSDRRSLWTNEEDDLPSSAWEKFNLLSLDGGGIRSYWSLLVLENLMQTIATVEERIADEEEAVAAAEDGDEMKQERDGKKVHHSFWPQPWPGHVSQVPQSRELKEKMEKAKHSEARRRALPAAQRYLPCHYFDYICGSGTGALIAIMLGRLRMTVPDSMHEYETLGKNVFGKPRHLTTLRFGFVDRTKYDAENLKRVFLDITKRRSENGTGLRRITFPSKRGLCKTFITSLRTKSGHRAVETLYLIRSYDHIRDIPMRPTRTQSNTREPGFEMAQDFEIWEVARAATAAPFYFEPLKIDIPNSKDYMSLADAAFSPYNNPTEVGVKEIERMNAAKWIGIVVSVGTARNVEGTLNRGPFNAIRSKLEQIATDTEGVHSLMTTSSAKHEFSYYRLNDPGALKMQLYEWEPKTSRINRKDSGSKTLGRIKTAFHTWAANNIDYIKRCAEELVRCRRARFTNQAKWERYATGAEYTCRMIGCQKDNFIDREHFRQHLAGEHGLSSEKQFEKELDECRRDWLYPSAPQTH